MVESEDDEMEFLDIVVDVDDDDEERGVEIDTVVNILNPWDAKIISGGRFASTLSAVQNRSSSF